MVGKYTGQRLRMLNNKIDKEVKLGEADMETGEVSK
jgi:hypothetical protein